MLIADRPYGQDPVQILTGMATRLGSALGWQPKGRPGLTSPPAPEPTAPRLSVRR